MNNSEDLVKIYQKTNSKNTLDEIIKQCDKSLRNISSFYYRKNSKNILLEDLKAAGTEGLILAINKYDSEKNKNFIPYANLWIKAKIRQHLLKNVTPFSIKDKYGRDNFINFYKKAPNNSKEYSAFYNAVELSYAVPDEENYVSSSITPEQLLLKKEEYTLFNQEISKFQLKIDDMEKYILKERLLSESPKTLEEISCKFKCTNQNISYREKKLLEKFKQHIFNSKFKDVFAAGTMLAY